ncbi:MAG: hypothetical protein SV375_03880 [Thermodesulfobacteriota bacterium]|nr:hypothetical protein [Thermodesulfobacteriota bacterium]
METKYDILKKVEKEAETQDIDIKVMGLGIAIDREQTTAVYDDEGNVVLDQRGGMPFRILFTESAFPFILWPG